MVQYVIDIIRCSVALGRPKGTMLIECKNGHALIDGNVYTWKGNRRCIVCKNDYRRKVKGYRWEHANEYHRHWTQRRKELLLDLRGSKCIDCGFDKHPAALHFDHIDPTIKQFDVAIGISHHSWNELVEEAEKCVIRCANCHAVKTWGKRTVWEYRNKR